MGESDWCFFSFFAVIGTDVFDMEKPVVFTYEEILSSTDGFSDSNLLGHGRYGSVYYGILRDQVWLCILPPNEWERFSKSLIFLI